MRVPLKIVLKEASRLSWLKQCDVRSDRNAIFNQEGLVAWDTTKHLSSMEILYMFKKIVFLSRFTTVCSRMRKTYGEKYICLKNLITQKFIGSGLVVVVSYTV